MPRVPGLPTKDEGVLPAIHAGAITAVNRLG